MQVIDVEGPPIGPSRLWYWIAGCLLAVAVMCVTLAVAGFLSLNRQINDFQRVPAPGHGEVTFTQPGGYVIYAETHGQCCSLSVGSGDSGPFANWSVNGALLPVNGAPPVSVASWHGLTESYAVAGHQGQTAAHLTITQPGSYVLTTKDVTPRTITDLAVGRGILPGIVMPVLLIAAGLAALIAAGLVFGVTAWRRRRARHRLLPASGFSEPMPGLSPGDARGPSGPVLVGFAGPARQRRSTVLVRIILAIPHFFCLYFVRFAALVVLLIGWCGALITGRLPDFAAEFLAGYQRWEVRLYAYLLLMTDEYPPFGWRDADYPVSVAARPGRLNRLAVLFRFILIIPAWCVGAALEYGLGTIMMFITWLIVVTWGRMPRPLYQAIAAVVRYWARIKAYWYLLTDVYPAGLFGDRPAPAPGWQAPHPVDLLPADYVTLPPAPAAASVAPAGGPGPLVLSRAAKGLVGLTLGIGAAVLIALLAAVVALPPAASPSPSAAAPGTSTTAPAGSAQARPAPSAVPAPPSSADQWLKGLQSLRTHMDDAMGTGTSTVTAASLRSTARQLNRCSSELAALGPPSAPLRPVYQMARQACADYQRGAACYAAAASAFAAVDPAASTPDAKLSRLLDCGDGGANKGAYLIANAVANGSFAQTPG